MARTFYDVLIVGAGHAGAQTAIQLRQRKFAGSIALVGDESDPPYERPPLSKEYFSGEKQFERILLRPEGFWGEKEIDLHLGCRVVSIDPANRHAVLANGDTIGFGTLVWATGGQPRQLTCPGHDLRGVHAIRTRADVDRLKRDLSDTNRVAVIGGGYIGLEAASALVKLGKAVTVFEALDRVLARVAGEPLSRFFEDLHRSQGVDVRLGTSIASIEGCNGLVSGVRLGDGSILDCETVIVGIGITPAVEPLLAAGAECPNGVLVDDHCRTSLPGIFAIGDCAAHKNRFANGEIIRLESVQNANDQAATVAKALTGTPEPYDALPWFWSSQYDLKLQTIGLSTGHDQVIVRGEPAAHCFSVIYLREGHVIALDCVNSVKDYVQGRALVQAGLQADVALLADPTMPLKAIAEPPRETEMAKQS